MDRVNARERDSFPASAFIFPEEKEYLLVDRLHAYDALRAAKDESPERAEKIREAVLERFNIGRSGAQIP